MGQVSVGWGFDGNWGTETIQLNDSMPLSVQDSGSAKILVVSKTGSASLVNNGVTSNNVYYFVFAKK